MILLSYIYIKSHMVNCVFSLRIFGNRLIGVKQIKQTEGSGKLYFCVEVRLSDTQLMLAVPIYDHYLLSIIMCFQIKCSLSLCHWPYVLHMWSRSHMRSQCWKNVVKISLDHLPMCLLWAHLKMHIAHIGSFSSCLNDDHFSDWSTEDKMKTAPSHW